MIYLFHNKLGKYTTCMEEVFTWLRESYVNVYGVEVFMTESLDDKEQEALDCVGTIFSIFGIKGLDYGVYNKYLRIGASQKLDFVMVHQAIAAARDVMYEVRLDSGHTGNSAVNGPVSLCSFSEKSQRLFVEGYKDATYRWATGAVGILEQIKSKKGIK